MNPRWGVCVEQTLELETIWTTRQVSNLSGPLKKNREMGKLPHAQGYLEGSWIKGWRQCTAGTLTKSQGKGQHKIKEGALHRATTDSPRLPRSTAMSNPLTAAVTSGDWRKTSVLFSVLWKARCQITDHKTTKLSSSNWNLQPVHSWIISNYNLIADVILTNIKMYFLCQQKYRNCPSVKQLNYLTIKLPWLL